MNKLTATSVSIGLVGGLMSWIYLGILGAAVAIPVSFIAWGAFAAAGGKNKDIVGTATPLIYGAIVAWITAFIIMPQLGQLIAGNADGNAISNALSVGISVVALIYGTGKIKAVAATPVAVYGYAAFFALVLSGTASGLTDASLTGNPLLFVAGFGIAGTVFGLIANNLAASIGK